MKLRCVIIDDEPLAIDLLKSYVVQTPFLELVGTYENPLSALETVRSGSVDLLYLDINMPQITGIEFSKTLPPSTRVIFTTAYDQYAVEGFRLNALDYLLKPISYSEFLQASDKAMEWFRLTQADKVKQSGATGSQSSIFVKSGYRMEKIDFDKILYIENQKDYVKFHLDGISEPVSSLMSMQSLDEKLPSQQFMRVHRSFIVNLEKVKTIERNCIVFGKEYIPVSDSYKDRFMEFLNKHFF
ncbi:LytR/AlgR family response regulator transcription factor [Dysgonomonas macrotermitis]|uniref:Two component transcriptional regulator, LytTR family n=1 Tax=Dysgonomonas macrotermitis TaxID=1346286 RepID=A0A1M5FKX3_9BACT|nr:LytTR family DNA-binding domain-containing protein [Dysgonomonas macrotermitis]SHF91792.1 two component transcriptional regulator, LytTR family [Dysgonomonas macrotermitis]